MDGSASFSAIVKWGGPAALAVVLAAVVLTTSAVGASTLPREEEHLYANIADVSLSTTAGEDSSLARLWRRRPLLLTMAFSRCHGVCPRHIEALASAVESIGGAGKDFSVLVVSLDPRDRVLDMATFARLRGLEGRPGWTFAVTSPAGIERLQRSIGAWADWDEGRLQFDHPAMIAAIDEGQLIRLLVGAEPAANRVKEMVWELRRQLVSVYPLPAKKVLFRCLGYDVVRGGIFFDWGMALLVLPVLVMAAVAYLVFRPSLRHKA